MPLHLAIPGSPTRRASMPPDAPAAALAAISALSDSIRTHRVFGFLEEPVCRAAWHAPRETLTVVCTTLMHPEILCPTYIDWRWGTLWQSQDWYETGWHPDRKAFALPRPIRERLWDALNPGKRPR